MEPMMADLGYTHSKLREAVRILARRPGQIRERLAYALAAVITISRDSFPDHLLGDFDDLMRTATAAEPSEGNIAAILAELADDEAMGLVDVILRLEDEVAAELRKLDEPEPN